MELARLNCRSLRLSGVRLLLGSWFDRLDSEQFDLIVSNPPYIAVGDPHLGQGDLRYEPGSALVAGPDGLDDLRRIVADAPCHLFPSGWLLLEHGYDQQGAVAGLLAQRGFVNISTRRDYGDQPRVTQGQWTPGREPSGPAETA